MTVSERSIHVHQAVQNTPRPVLAVLNIVRQRLAAQVVARDNARRAAQAMRAGRREREEVEEFLDSLGP